MNTGNSKKNEIPSRKGVHLRNPSGNKEIKNLNTKKNTANTQKPNQSPAKSKSTKTSGVTPAQRAREREINEYKIKLKKQREYEIKKQQAIKAYERKKNLEKIKSGFSTFLKNALVGIILAAVIFLIIGMIYFRNATKFTNSESGYSVEFYDYIDESSEDEETLTLLDERKKGTEKPHFTLKDKIKVSNGAAYLPFSEISDYFDLTVSGDNKARTLIIGNSQSEFSGTNSVVFIFNTKEIKINGAGQTLENNAFLSNNELYIPLEFIKSYVKGIDIVSDTDSNSVLKITKTLPSIYFSASDNIPLGTPDIGDYVSSSESRHEYSIDLSDYQQYINPKDPDAYLTLVNNQNRLSQDYIPNDLSDVIYTRNDRETQKMRLDAAKSLEAFLKAAYASGHSDVTVTSAYRSYAYQSSLFNTRLEQNKKTYGAQLAEAKTAEFTAYPGSSEHQSGLCCDMHNLPSAMQSFANTDAYKWLYEHCADFGFILRYPKSKEEVTGIKYEPWHFRFVGRYHAQKIMDSGLSLEEYVANLNNNG